MTTGGAGQPPGLACAPSSCFGFGTHNLRLGQPQRHTETGYLQGLLSCGSESGYLGFGRAGRVSKSPTHCFDFQAFPGMYSKVRVRLARGLG